MKAMLGCLILLASILLGAFFYSSQMSHTAEHFAQRVTDFYSTSEDERGDLIAKLVTEWKKQEILFSLGIPHSELDRIETEFVHLSAAAEAKDDGEFYLAVALLSDAFKHVGNLYEASLDNIL